ncbi:uncharacterized protein LOC131946718 [Physella acuta]|uniref:uncharacterized protein LOC131946718 n=1 Tax=Physella acuta TaxID=109671 RepID=UPI0027DC5B57|nr:uncharacterized protein LOC131946718 [Physella acuta]
MMAMAKLVLFAAIVCQAYVGSVRMLVTLLTHTFEGIFDPLYPPSSSSPRFKDCIINDLLNGIQIQDISRQDSAYATYRDKGLYFVRLNISVSDLIPVATINCSEVMLNVVEMVCQVTVTTADSYIAMIPLLNVWTKNDCRFLFRYSSGPAKQRLESLGVMPPAPIPLPTELAPRNNSKGNEELSKQSKAETQYATIIGLAIGLIVLIVVFAVFVYIIKDKIKSPTTEKQQTQGFCIADHSDVINTNKHGVPCSSNVYRTPYGEWDTEGGHRHRDLYALPAVDNRYSCRTYETPDIIKEQSQAEGYIDQPDYIEVIDHYSSISKKT